MQVKLTFIYCVLFISACDFQPEKNHPKELSAHSIQKMKARCIDKLHKVESKDDLILQMFETALEDDCLYVYEPEELEKIWGIPVFNFVPSGWRPSIDPPRLLNKDIESRLGLYVEKKTMPSGNVFFDLNMTLKEFSKHWTLFPERRFPRSLPRPKSYVINSNEVMDYGRWTYKTPYQSYPEDPIQTGHTYYWIDGERAVTAGTMTRGVDMLTFINYRGNTELNDEQLSIYSE